MANIEKVGQVGKTFNYDMFKKMDGNRDVTERRVQKIINSVKKVGQLESPIMVNERMEVIDGQGRLEAFRRLGLPVYFVTVRGAGLESCMTINANQTNWKIRDFIRSGAERGNESYRYLQILVDRFSKEFSLSVICAAAAKTIYGANNEIIKEGRLSISDADYTQAINLLEYLGEYKSLTVEGRKDYFYAAVLWIVKSGAINGEKLKRAIFRNRALLEPIASTRHAVEVIEKMYNYRARNKVYIREEYERRRKAENKS